MEKDTYADWSSTALLEAFLALKQRKQEGLDRTLNDFDEVKSELDLRTKDFRYFNGKLSFPWGEDVEVRESYGEIRISDPSEFSALLRYVVWKFQCK